MAISANNISFSSSSLKDPNESSIMLGNESKPNDDYNRIKKRYLESLQFNIPNNRQNINSSAPSCSLPNTNFINKFSPGSSSWKNSRHYILSQNTEQKIPQQEIISRQRSATYSEGKGKGQIQKSSAIPIPISDPIARKRSHSAEFLFELDEEEEEEEGVVSAYDSIDEFADIIESENILRSLRDNEGKRKNTLEKVPANAPFVPPHEMVKRSDFSVARAHDKARVAPF